MFFFKVHIIKHNTKRNDQLNITEYVLYGNDIAMRPHLLIKYETMEKNSYVIELGRLWKDNF